MRPILFHIGSSVVSSYYTFITLGIFLGLYFFYHYSKKAKLDPVVMIDVSLIITATAYIGARLFHVIFEMPGYYLYHPLQIFYFWRGGYVMYGGILFPLIFIYIYAKRKNIPFLKITDTLVPAVAIGNVLGRVACLMQGCCYGCPTDMPWGIVFPEGANGGLTPTGVPLHPTQIYISVLSLVMFLILNWRFDKREFTGELTYWYLSLYAVGRSIIEFYRDDFRGDIFDPYLSTSQFISLIVLIISLYMLIKNYRKKNA